MASKNPEKAHSLMPFLVDIRHLRRSARLCMRRRSAPGIDRVTWKSYRQNLATNLQALSERLRHQDWQPSELRVIDNFTFFGKNFTLAIPTVEDRIVHRAMKFAISKVLEERAFLDFVSGFRPGRNRINALRLANEFRKTGLDWVVDVDVKDVSNGCSLEHLLNLLAKYISDGRFLSTVKAALSIFPNPLFVGSGLSPLLINLRLTPVDIALADSNVVRFCDNYVCFSSSNAESKAIFRKVEEVLSQHGLRANLSKSKIRDNPNIEDLFLVS